MAPFLQTQAVRWRKRQCWQRLSGSDGAAAAANSGGSNGNGAAIAAMVSDDDKDKQVSAEVAGRERYAAHATRSWRLAAGRGLHNNQMVGGSERSGRQTN